MRKSHRVLSPGFACRLCFPARRPGPCVPGCAGVHGASRPGRTCSPVPAVRGSPMPGLGDTEDLEQLRRYNLELLKRLWVGQEAVQRSVAKAFTKLGLYSCKSINSKNPAYPDTSSASLITSGSQDREQEEDTEDAPGGDPWNGAWVSRTSPRVTSLPPTKCPRSQGILRSRPTSLPVPTEPKEPPQARTPPSRQRNSYKPTVTFYEKTAVPEESWRLRPYLGYDWIAGALDSISPVTSESEAFFSSLQNFREANKEDCMYGYSKGQFQGFSRDGDMEDSHQCMYCYRVNRRLFPVPVDPGAPCRLCGTPRDQRGPEKLLQPAQVRVSIPLSLLDPPHQYRIHCRKSCDLSDSLALPQHCLLGWDSFPPRLEHSSSPKSLDLWSSVYQAQRQTQPATTPSLLTLGVPASIPVWSQP